MGRQQLEKHAAQLSALGHPARLAILRFVVQGDREGTAVGDIQSHVDIPASTLSHHLRRLAAAELVSSRTHGTFIYYRANYDVLRGLTTYLWEDCCKRGKAGSKECC
jgi:ArsR family transcriptional regulator, arsenate/arsenite/antimonite-responsive transcriptional repressor